MIYIDRISKQYSGNTVLDNIIIKIQEFEFVAIVGNNGAGKTTLINLLASLDKPDKGAIFVNNNKISVSNNEYKKDIGFVFDKPIFIEDFSIIEYLSFVCRFQKIKKKEFQKRVSDLLSFLDIEKEKSKSINKLSSGNQMKVSIISALIHNPQILILDEPFIHLDTETSNNIVNLLKSFKGKKTLLITSHNLDLVSELVDRFIILDKGKIIAEVKKSDYNNIEELKNKTKSYLVSENNTTQINWLK